jgi:methylphosphotriester-DNA--protein-cysteine methyltransferase
MMQYQKFHPCEKLQPFVECYFTWDSSTQSEELVIESPPSGFGSIVFNYGDPYFLQNKKYERLAVPMQFISGQSIYSYKLFLPGNIGQAGIVFKPAALATLFDLPMYDYTEERVDLYSVFKKEVIDKYAVAIKNAGDAKDRVELLEAFILDEYELRQPKADYIDEAATLIVEKNGMLQVNDLLKYSFMSRRTFERKFFQKVGLSPKYYARIRRIGFICNLIAGKKKVDWPQVFYECEFYDQAHFIKDFLEFTGRTPQQYLKENTELANYVEKPVARALE